MLTSFFGNITSIPSLAYSYNFFPLTLTAEYFGTSCMYFPLKELTTSYILSLDVSTVSVDNIFPSISSVSVSIPKVIPAIYSLSLLVSNSHIFKAFPKHTTNTPVAAGSSVPVCPTFLVLNFFPIILTTSRLVYPFSLLIISIPFIFIYYLYCLIYNILFNFF